MATATARTAKPSDLPRQRVGVKTALKAVRVDEPGPLPDEPSIMNVDPELAAAWLLRNTRNRGVREDAVNAMARDMTAKAWKFTGAAISFDTDGVLADGQHRLLAVVKSHTTQRFMVVVGLDPEAMVVIDTGAKRNVADVVTMQNHAGEVGAASTIAAAARLGVLMEMGAINDGRQQLTSTEIVTWIRDHDDIAEYARRAKGMRKHADVAPAVLAYTMWRLAQVDGEEAEAFFADWRDSQTTGSGDPLVALIQRLRSAKDGRERLPRGAAIAMIFRAWNARRAGKRLTIMKATSTAGRIDIPEPK